MNHVVMVGIRLFLMSDEQMDAFTGDFKFAMPIPDECIDGNAIVDYTKFGLPAGWYRTHEWKGE